MPRSPNCSRFAYSQGYIWLQPHIRRCPTLPYNASSNVRWTVSCFAFVWDMVKQLLEVCSNTGAIDPFDVLTFDLVSFNKTWPGVQASGCGTMSISILLKCGLPSSNQCADLQTSFQLVLTLITNLEALKPDLSNIETRPARHHPFPIYGVVGFLMGWALSCLIRFLGSRSVP